MVRPTREPRSAAGYHYRAREGGTGGEAVEMLAPL